MEFSVRVVGHDDDRAVTSLYRWLAQDPDVRRHVTVSLTPAPHDPGDMGDAVELINVVLSNGIALGGLLLAVLSWRRSRPRPPMTYLERDGVRIGVPRQLSAPVGRADPEDDGAAPPQAPAAVTSSGRTQINTRRWRRMSRL